MARRLFLNSSKISFSEQFFPARPKRLWSKARKMVRSPIVSKRTGAARADNKNYVKWLVDESMLAQGERIARKYSAKGSMWQRPFARPRPRTAVKMASVWYTAYGPSLVTKDNETILSTLGSDDLWEAFEEIGIDALHTGPVKLAGGVTGWTTTPSIDGHFDRISTKIDSVFGSEDEFRSMASTAKRHGGIVIDDIIPGHTGKGFDFRLAELGYGEYPGIYHMVEIHPEDWDILPDISKDKDSANLSIEAEEELKQRGYIIGKLQRVIFYEPGVKETNWSATRPIKGVDGITRRWVYLHYFKDGQPSINWLDPSFAGMKLVVGDALHSLGELGSNALRLDANGFLGVEKSSEDKPAWSEGHPLSEAANLLISGMVRKMGGFTFQELNLAIDDIKTMSQAGADLSYDFINRPAYHHALVKADTEFLRIMLRTGLECGIDPASLVHALQNHDDLTFELVHFWTIHKDDLYEFRNTKIPGIELRKIIRQELTSALTGEKGPYNLLFTTNGIACTTTSLIAAVLGYKDFSSIEPKDIDEIKNVHLLLAMFNAWQPGVFALSGWDLCGSLTIDPNKVSDLMVGGDTRWINRGGYDLLGINPNATQSTAGMPIARGLYGTLTEQIEDENSFVSRLKNIIEVRKKFGIDISHQIDIPNVSNKSMLVMVHRLDGAEDLEVTVLNFSNEYVSGTVSSEHLPAGAKVIDMMSGHNSGKVDDLKAFTVNLMPYQGLALLITEKDHSTEV